MFEVLMETLSQVGFSYMAITGEPYCDSVKKGFLVNFKHLWGFLAQDISSGVIVTSGVIFSSSFGCLASYIFMAVIGANEFSTLLTATITYIIAIVISSQILAEIDMIVKQMFTCMAVDMDLSGGRPTRGPPKIHENMDKHGELLNDDSCQAGVSSVNIQSTT